MISELRLVSKLMTSQPGKQTITVQILRNISKSKNNQTMTFDQLIKFNMRNIFLENHTQNEVEKLYHILS